MRFALLETIAKVPLFSYISKKNCRGVMSLGRPFFLTFSFFLILWGFGAYPANHSAEIQKIDSEIEQLEDMKRGYEARALKHDDMATYLQFDTKAVLETRRHIQLAQENRNKAALVQERIDRLKAKRAELQK